MYRNIRVIFLRDSGEYRGRVRRFRGIVMCCIYGVFFLSLSCGSFLKAGNTMCHGNGDFGAGGYGIRFGRLIFLYRRFGVLGTSFYVYSPDSFCGKVLPAAQLYVVISQFYFAHRGHRGVWSSVYTGRCFWGNGFQKGQGYCRNESGRSQLLHW